MSTYKKLTTVCAAVVLAFGLAACGGGDDDDTAMVADPGPTQAELDAAQMAAEEAAAKAAEEEAAKEAAEQALADKEAADAAAAAALMGQQLHGAMDHNGAAAGADALMNLMSATADTTVTPNQAAVARSSLTPSGVTVGYQGLVDGTNPNEQVTRVVASPLMKATGDALDAINGWEGQHYAHSAAGVSNEARVYTFRAAAPGKPAAEVFGDDRTTSTAFVGSRQEIADADAYDPRTRVLTFDGTSPANRTSPRFMSDHFAAAGQTTHRPNDEGAIAVEGTYDGVPGTYRCAPATAGGNCTSTKQAGAAGVLLDGGIWSFKHESGATTSVPDSAYQYFGWWLTKTDGAPTSASAIFGIAGTGTQSLRDLMMLQGTASYSGSAAGKWAIDDPIGDTGDAGHFTADVALTAKFGTADSAGNESGISGSLTNFMANEEAVPWSVTLRRASFNDEDTDATNGQGSSIGLFSRASGGTVWSIDGNAADPSGNWNGQMYDDGVITSDVPTAVVGAFHSEAGSTHRMVGGFGARQD